MRSDLQKQKPVKKANSVKLSAEIIKLSLEQFWLLFLRVVFICLGYCVKSLITVAAKNLIVKAAIKSFNLERFIVSYAETCLDETVNNESNSNLKWSN